MTTPVEPLRPTLDCLNAAFANDPSAIHALIVNRVPCNQALVDHPFIIVEASPVLANKNYQVGALGLINGILTANGLPRVAVMFQDVPGEEQKRIVGFCEYKPPEAATADRKQDANFREQYSADKERRYELLDRHHVTGPPLNPDELSELQMLCNRVTPLPRLQYGKVSWTNVDNDLRGALITKKHTDGNLTALENEMLAMLQEKAKEYADQVAPITPLPPELENLVHKESWKPPQGTKIMETSGLDTAAALKLMRDLILQGIYSSVILAGRSMNIVGIHGGVLHLRDAETGESYCVQVDELTQQRLTLYLLPK